MKLVNAIKKLEKEGYQVTETALNSGQYIAYYRGRKPIEFRANDEEVWSIWVGIKDLPNMSQAIRRSRGLSL